ncbi:MAG: MFS transporter [Caulobacterales bacterium]
MTPSRSLFTGPAARITLAMSAWFGAWGVTLPFLPRWLEAERGLTGAEIGAVLAAAQMMRIFFGPALAAWADGFADRRTAFRIMSLATLAAYALFFFTAHGFLALFFLGFAAMTAAQTLGPLIESAALRASQRAGEIPFGVARGIGSLAYILGNIGGGALIAAIGLIGVPLWTLGFLVISNIAAWFLLAPDPAPADRGGFRLRIKSGLELARTPRFLLLLFGAGFILSAHAFYYGFSTIIWRKQGIAADVIGYLWAIGVVFEVLLLFALPRIERWFGPGMLILIGAAAGIVRWIGLSFAPVNWLLWPLQALHALTFSPVHVGVLHFIQRNAPDAQSVFIQTLYASLHGGLLIGSAMLASGWLYDHVGAQGYWAMAALNVLGGALIVALVLKDKNAPRLREAR